MGLFANAPCVVEPSKVKLTRVSHVLIAPRENIVRAVTAIVVTLIVIIVCALLLFFAGAERQYQHRHGSEATFDPNDAERTFGWSVNLWKRAAKNAPRGNGVALVEERDAANRDFRSIVGRSVKWPMRAGGVLVKGECLIRWPESERQEGLYLLAVYDTKVPPTLPDEVRHTTPFKLADPRRTTRIGDGDTVTVEGTVAEAKLEVGAYGEYRAMVGLKSPLVR